MARTRKSFPPELLEELRAMPVVAALDALGLYWKYDPDFVPVKDKSTVRLNVSLGGGGVELLATGPKWYDTRAEKGGGGAVDLAMYLLRLDFVTAVKRFQSNWGRFRKRKIKHAKPSFHPPASSGMTLAVSVWGMPQLDVRPER